MVGCVISSHGRNYIVEDPVKNHISCVAKGHKQNIVINDRVHYQMTSVNQGLITGIESRTSLLYRSDAYHQKMLVANIDQVVAVTAVWPPLYESLLSRILLAAEAARVSVLIVLNKTDLPESKEAMPLMQYYESLGYRLIKYSMNEPVSCLLNALSGHTNFLIGQSGVGKSTLLNRLLPNANARTKEVSETLRSGRHTTTHSTLHHLDAITDLIDSPGLQEFGLAHVPLDELVYAFVEFRPYIGQCRFNNCLHLIEPGCAVIEAVNNGKIRRSRHELHVRLLTESGSRSCLY